MPVETARIVMGRSPRVEDRAEVIPVEDGVVVVVADGAGGRPGGAEAADGVVRQVRLSIEAAPVPRTPAAWVQVLRRIDATLADDPKAGETTGIVALVSEAGVVGASVGDSGAWLIGADSWADITSGLARKPFLGWGAAEPRSLAAPRGQATLLFATDGLLKYTSPERIREVVRGTDLQLAPSRLVELVRYPSGDLPDDVSVVLARWC